jgi:HEAT repeat protein
MDTNESNINNNRRIYTGVDWRKVQSPILLKPNDSLRFCDLRGCTIDGLDLSKIELLGCRLDGTSFRGSNLQEAQITGCFSSHHALPTDFRNCIWKNVAVTDSHINCLHDQKVSNLGRWSDENVELAWNTLSENNGIRYQAVNKIGALGNPVLAPLAACLLSDEEWDVRSATLDTLNLLRGKKFPHQDQVFLEWMFLCLGDKHPIVRQTSESLVEVLSPSDEILLVSVQRMMVNSIEQQLSGLRAAVELCRFNDDYSRLVQIDRLEKLLSSEVAEVRTECLHLIGILDNPLTLPWLLRGLHDPVVTVRIAALSAIRLLSDLPPAILVTPLLKDPDEEVRLEAVYTLGQIGNFDRQEIEVALSDTSENVRQATLLLLEGN